MGREFSSLFPIGFSKSFKMASNPITLDVGGTIFRTTVATLIQYPNSMLAAMFDPKSERPPAMKDDNGNFFIDRDPEPFRIILSFLRSAVLPEDIVGCSLQQVELEADYYGLKELLKKIGDRKKEEPKMSSLDCDERAAEIRENAFTIASGGT